jgi:cysteine desulfurase
VIRLDKAGFAVSTGSACTTGKEEPSHVLSAMGYKSAQAMRAVRFSAGWETTEPEWDALLKAVVKINGEMQHGKGI